MSDHTETTAPETCRRCAKFRASRLSKLALGAMLVAVGAALPVSALADSETDNRYAAMDKQESMAKFDKAKARAQLFQAAAEELRKNPQAADLPECSTMRAANTGLCIRKPAVAPAGRKAPA